MDRDLEDLVEACQAVGGSTGLLRALLRQAKETPQPASAIAYLASSTAPALTDNKLRRDIGVFLQIHGQGEAALVWLAGDEPLLKLERARLLLALDRKSEAAVCYREAVQGDPSLRVRRSCGAWSSAN